MPKEAITISYFRGLMSNADDEGMSLESPVYSENIDPIGPMGRLQGIPTWSTTDLPSTNSNAVDSVMTDDGYLVFTTGSAVKKLSSDFQTISSISSTSAKRGTLVASATEVFYSTGSASYVYTNVPSVSEYFGDTNPPSGGWKEVPQAVETDSAFSLRTTGSVTDGFAPSVGSSDIIEGEYFMGISVVHNNGSESDLQRNIGQCTVTGGCLDLEFDLEVDYASSSLSNDTRITTVNVYVAYNPETNATSPATSYRLAKTISATDTHWTNDATSGFWEALSGTGREILDVFSGPTYEANADQREEAGASSMTYTSAADLFSRMAVAVSSRVHFSRPLQYAVFDNDRDYVDLPNAVRQLIGHQGKLFAFMEGGTAIINVNGPEPFVEEILDGVGIHASCLPLSTDYGLFHMSDNQLYLNLKPIGFPVINGVASNGGTVDYAADTKTSPFVAFDYHRGCALFFTGIPTDGDDSNHVYVYSLVKKEWYFWKLPEAEYCFYGNGDDLYLWGAGASPQVRKLFAGATYLTWKWESRAIDFGKPNENKWFYTWNADYNNGAWTTAHVLRCDDGSAITTHQRGASVTPRPQLWGKIELDQTSTSANSCSSVTVIARRKRTPRLVNV